MGSYVLRRILSTIPVLLGASIIIFLLIRLIPGDAATALAGPEATREDLQIIRARLGLDQPIIVQYLSYMQHALSGDLGYSYFYKDSITHLVAGAMPATLELSFVALLISLVVALPVGVLSATRRNSWIDHSSMVVAVLGISMDEDGWEKVLPFLQKVRAGYPILMGNKRVAYLYGDVESLPFTISNAVYGSLPDTLLEFMRQQRCGRPFPGARRSGKAPDTDSSRAERTAAACARKSGPAPTGASQPDYERH